MSISLRVHVQNPRPAYAPGDELTGQVVLTTATDHAIGNVRIILFGRAKTRLVRTHGQSESVYRGRAVFFRLSQDLFEDHFTRKPTTFSWPFAFTIPEHPIAGHLGREWRPNGPFLSSNLEESTISLPSTFSTSGWGLGHRFRAHTEYYLQAVATEPARSSIFSRRSTTTSLHRFRLLKSHRSPSPITNFNLTRLTKSDSFRTLRLLPEYASARLTLGEKTKSLFRPSSLPKYAFNVFVTAPRALQLHNPSPIPFYVSLEPVRTDSTIEESNLPPIQLTSFTLAIKSKTRVRAPGMWDRYDSTTDTVEICRMVLSHVVPHSTVSESTPEAGTLSSGCLDLGTLCNLKLRPWMVTPSFETYNIVHQHSLIYKLVLECAGDKVNFEVKPDALPITVFGPPLGSIGADSAALALLPSYESLDSDDEEDSGNTRKTKSGLDKAKEASEEGRRQSREPDDHSRRAGGESLPAYKP